MVTPLDDRALVTAAQQGDRGAMDQLLRRHYDRIYAVCRRIVGNDSDAADASQEAMIAMVRSLARFDGRSTISTWAYRIATNASLDELRRRRRRPMLAMPARDDLPHEVADPDSGLRIDSIGDRELLDQALAGLAEEFRVPVVLRDIADLDYAEIVLTLDIPVGTVKSRIARGRAALAVALSAPGNQTTPHERQTNTP